MSVPAAEVARGNRGSKAVGAGAADEEEEVGSVEDEVRGAEAAAAESAAPDEARGSLRGDPVMRGRE